MMRRWINAACVLIALAGACSQASAQPTTEEPPKPETQLRFSVALKDGDLQLADLLGQLANEIGLDGEFIRQHCDYVVPVRTPLGSTTVRLISSLTDGVVEVGIGSDAVTVTVDRVRWRQQREVFDGEIRDVIEHFFPEAAAKAKARFGAVVYTTQLETQPITGDNAPAAAVVLIHGLDDAGELWGQLVPRLMGAGYGVCEITYPNDQPIADSTAFVSSLFEEMRRDGVQRVAIVAHSMGGLVSRDLITSSAYYHSGIDGGERYPRIDRLIMLGPPNHGSKMAMFRLGSEVRDQVVRALSGDGLLIGGFFDGAGEAQDDLAPDSAFLTNLNARPLPADLPVTIIAGSASPFTASGIASMVERLNNMGKSKYGNFIDGSRLEQTAGDLVDGVGDGCVSLESTRLPEVTDYVVVEANHLSMIKNLLPTSDRVPPAVPIILDRLAKDK